MVRGHVPISLKTVSQRYTVVYKPLPEANTWVSSNRESMMFSTFLICVMNGVTKKEPNFFGMTCFICHKIGMPVY